LPRILLISSCRAYAPLFTHVKRPFGTRYHLSSTTEPVSNEQSPSRSWTDDEINATTEFDDAATGQKHEVLWIDDDDDIDEDRSIGEAIADGEVILLLPDIATPHECSSLSTAGLDACERRETPSAARGRNRFSVSDPTAFSSEIVLSCDEILTRALNYLDDFFPSIYETLFEPGEEWAYWQPLNAALEQPTVPPNPQLANQCTSLSELYLMGEMEWSEGEPAINIYESAGYFGAHKDHLALTILIPLTDAHAGDFDGGGTGFWCGNRDVDENPGTDPDWVLTPSAGTALVFGGDVTHAGLAVDNGYRAVLVCSFSTRTSVSNKDRLHGLQAPPQVSPNFKGSM